MSMLLLGPVALVLVGCSEDGQSPASAGGTGGQSAGTGASASDTSSGSGGGGAVGGTGSGTGTGGVVMGDRYVAVDGTDEGDCSVDNP